MSEAAERPGLRRYAVVSIVAALITIALKGGAYFLTGSVALLSDALESLVNLAAAIFALVALWIAEQPEDEEHAYGHSKAEYFASGFEGALVLFAALSIAFSAVRSLLDPRPVQDLGTGIAISVVASLINFAVARVLFQAAHRYESITLEADAHHLMSDVWTSVGVISGVTLAAWSGWAILDPLVALVVAINILRIGMQLLHRSALGLLDTSLPEETRRGIVEILDAHRAEGVQYHALRTRQAGVRRFISFHILVPGDWSVQRGHDLLEEIEDAIRARVPYSTVFTHLEPLEDPASWEDVRLERRRGDRRQMPGAG